MPAEWVKKGEWQFPMRLTLSFDRPVSAAEARELARRLLERTAMSLDGAEAPESFAEARLSCSSLRRVIRIGKE